MKQKERLSIRYSIWDPSGNITALAEIGSQQSDAAQEDAAELRKGMPPLAKSGSSLAESETQLLGSEKETAAELRRGMPPLAEIGSPLAESETQLPGSEKEAATELRRGMPPLAEIGSPLAEIAAQIMKKHPEVEQVGFVRDTTPPEEEIQAELFMAGGEFCGNAAMCAAAWYAERNQTPDDPEQELYLKVSGAEEAVKVHLQKEEEGIYSGNGRASDVPEQELYLKVSGAEEAVKVHLQKEEEGIYSGNGRASDDPEQELYLKVSGAEEAVKVHLQKEEEGIYDGSVWMPAATGITYVRLQYDDVRGTLPLVSMQGISHLIIEEDSAFFRFLEERERAETMVRDQAEERGLEGLGLMFLKRQGMTPLVKNQDAVYSLKPPVKRQGAEYSLTPLVYIRTAGTLFWENSCGSGSSACGMYLAEKEKQPVDLELVQPGGRLRVRGDLQNGIRLSGRVKKAGEYEL